MAIDNSKELYVDIDLNTKAVKEQTQIIANAFDGISNSIINISKQLHNISVNVGNMFANMRNEATKTADTFNKAFIIFQRTGNLTKSDIRKAKQQGNAKTYRLAKGNVAQETFLGNINTEEVVKQQEILKQQEKLLRERIKIEEGILVPKKQYGEVGYEQQRTEQLILQYKKKQLDEEIKLKNQLNETKKTSISLYKYIAKIGLTIAGFRRLGQTIGELVKESGSWIENLNLFEVTFGDTYQKSLDWAVEFSKQLGFSVNEMVKFTGLFKQLSTSIGIAQETGDKLAETLTSIGTDITSFYNLSDVQTAMEKLQAGIYSGQTKPLVISGTTKRLIVKKHRICWETLRAFDSNYVMKVA